MSIFSKYPTKKVEFVGDKIGSDWFELEGLPFRGPMLEYQRNAFSRMQKIVQFLEKK